MDEDGALAMARALAKRGVGCRVTSACPFEYWLLVGLTDGREALWDGTVTSSRRGCCGTVRCWGSFRSGSSVSQRQMLPRAGRRAAL